MTHAPRTAIISHRGGTFLWPENSLEAFRETLDLPVDMAECDAHLASDNVPIVIHDSLLDRTTEARGAVSSFDSAALGEVRLRGGRGGRVPSLEEVGHLFRGRTMQLQVEIKADSGGRTPPALMAETLAVLDRCGIRQQCHIIAFDAAQAAAAQQAGGLAGVVWLFSGQLLRQIGLEGVVAVARAYQFTMIETEIGALDEAVCTHLRQAGFRLAAWGANDGTSLRKAFALGLDAVATDDPVLATRLR